MPTVADLARLESLVQRLGPLSRKQRGELIEAADWNALAGALLELARINLGENTSDAVAGHEHPDQVDLGWLTPRLRSLITEGSLRDPAGEAQLAQLDRQLARLADRHEQIVQRLDRLQGDIKGVETRDITREADLTRFGRRLDGAFDARNDVARLRTSLRTLETDVRTAVDLSRRLQDEGGEDLDFAALAGRVRELEALRTSLTTPEGVLMSAAEYERRFAELRATLVTEDELDEALSGIRGEDLLGNLRGSLLEEGRTVARTAADERIGGLRDELTARIDRQLAGLDDRIDTRLAPATAGLREDILTAARGERETAVTSALGELRESLATERDARLETLSGRLDADLASLRDGLAQRVDGLFTERLDAATARIDERVTATEAGVAELRATTEANGTAHRANATDLAASRRELAAADSSLRADLVRRLGELDAGVGTRIEQQLAGLRDDLRSRLQGDLEGLVRGLESRLAETVRRNVATEVSLASNRLLNDVTGLVEGELASVRAELEATVAARVEGSANRISGLVADEVRRSLTNLDDRIRREVEAIDPVVRRNVRRPAGPG